VELEARFRGEGAGWQSRGARRRSAFTPGRRSGRHVSLPYFEVDDLAAALSQVGALGGSVVHPGERWAICKDSEGSPSDCGRSDCNPLRPSTQERRPPPRLPGVRRGDIDLVLVPATPATSRLMWEHEPVARALEAMASFRPGDRLRPRGSGLSDRRRAPTLEERMDDVRAVMDAAASESAALIGSPRAGR